VLATRICQIIHGKHAMTADTALCLGRYFGTDAQSWLNLQTQYDLEVTHEAFTDRLDHEVKVL
jgi:addiction module HigA family antidote